MVVIGEVYNRFVVKSCPYLKVGEQKKHKKLDFSKSQWYRPLGYCGSGKE